MQSQAGEPAGAAPRAELSLCQKPGVQTGGAGSNPQLCPAWCQHRAGLLPPAVGMGQLWGSFSGQPWGTGLVRHARPWRCWSRVPVRVRARGLYMPCAGARVPARCKVARSGLLLCRGHKGKCWVQQLGTGPGRGFQRCAGCDDGAAAQTLMSSHFLCAPARGLPLPGYKVGAPLHPETQARSLQQEAAAAQVRGPSARAAALAPAGPEGGREKHRGSSVPSHCLERPEPITELRHPTALCGGCWITLSHGLGSSGCPREVHTRRGVHPACPMHTRVGQPRCSINATPTPPSLGPGGVSHGRAPTNLRLVSLPPDLS